MYAKYFKRPFDFICSLLALIVLSPVLLILYILIRCNMGAPVLFRQTRPGKDEKLFDIYKFRTMTSKKGPDGKLLPDAERLTKLGLFLRKTSLDELPELINILKGDMSLVGPRPLFVQYLPLYNEEQKRRHTVRPGLSGLAQVHGRNALTWEEKFEWDIRYVDNITFLGDMRIIFETVWKAFIRQEGISHEGSATMEVFTGTKQE
ncbi:MAG: sugar transferase [Clostridia bacterium]|nr:sugar transferase [Clostridia bacterium]